MGLSNNRKRLLAWSDSPTVNSGFGKISKEVLFALHSHFDFEIEQVALNHFGHFYDPKEIPWQVHSGTLLSPNDIFACLGVLKALEERHYDYFWIQIDIQHMQAISEQIAQLKAERLGKGGSFPTIVYYVPVDMPVSEECKPTFTLCDEIVTYTEFGKKQISRILPSDKDRIKVIGCGNKPAELQRCSDEERASFRKSHFNITDDKTFLVININRNTPRKLIPSTLAAFSAFKKQNENAKLYLHTELRSSDGGIDLPQAIFELGLHAGKDVLIADDFGLHNTVPADTLASIYSAADCFFTSSFGEGWGLNHTDAMAMEVPVVAPANTVFPEHLGENGERGYLYPCEEQIWVDGVGFRPHALASDAARALQSAYDDFRTSLEKGESPRSNPRIQYAKTWVQQFAWERVLEQWIHLFQDLEEREKSDSVEK